MSAEVANVDFKVTFTNNAGPPDLVYTGDLGEPDCTVTKSTTCDAPSGKDICTRQINFSFGRDPCPHTSLTHTFSIGVGQINATATKTNADGDPVLRKGDKDTAGGPSIPGFGCFGQWILPGSPPTTVPCQCDIEITDAGQTKVKAN